MDAIDDEGMIGLSFWQWPMANSGGERLVSTAVQG